MTNWTEKSTQRVIKKPFRKSWEATHNARGLRRKIGLKCVHKDVSPHPENSMFLRFSQVYPDKSPTYFLKEPHFEMVYKCYVCGWLAYFAILVEKDYALKILKLRNGVSVYVPPRSEWEEHEGIKKQLEALGYVGGR